jgi:hypothetical protein
MPGVDQFELGWMGEHRFGDERLAQLDQLGLVTAAMTAASSACAAGSSGQRCLAICRTLRSQLACSTE